MRADAWIGAARVGFAFMAMQQPVTSGSHWRIPAPHYRLVSHTRLSGHTSARAISHAGAERLREHGAMVISTALTMATLGGVFVAPLAVLVALAVLLMPGHNILRPLAAPLIVGAVLWLALAILCAHARHTDATPGDDERQNTPRI